MMFRAILYVLNNMYFVYISKHQIIKIWPSFILHCESNYGTEFIISGYRAGEVVLTFLGLVSS